MTAQLSPEAVIRSYFDLVDAGDPKILELFSDDFEFYFPGFGVGRGRDAFAACMTGFQGKVDELRHHMDDLEFTMAGNRVVVEGTTEGRIGTKTWNGGTTPGGRFCSVFDVDGGRIVRMYVYLDPDYTSDNDLGFPWPADREVSW
jgi:ketosteroid isomerase-like protein